MYTIIMNNDKQLITSVRKTLYQREKMVNKIQFLFPECYEDINLTDCTVVLKYIDIGNVLHSEVLAKDSELYKGKFRCILPVDTKLNMFAGNIIIRVIFMKIDTETGVKNEVLKTGECLISILPDNTIVYADEDITEKITIMESQIAELSNNQVDDLILNDDLLKVSANGVEKGNGVNILIPTVTDKEYDGVDDGILNLDSIDESVKVESSENNEGFIEL